MTDDGKQIFRAFFSLRNFCSDISRMLVDCDRLMKDQDWDAPATALSGSSASINYPQRWIPYEIFRIYRRKHVPGVVKSLSIVLDDEWHEGRIVEPIVVATSFLVADESQDDQIEYWDPHWWFLGISNRKLDATVYNIDSSTPFSKEFSRFREILTFGCHLTDIVDKESIKMALTDKLLLLHG